MGKEFVIDNLDDMCALMCDNVIPTTNKDAVSRQAVLDKIRAEIEQFQADCDLSCSDDANCRTCNNITFGSIYRIIDKYRKGDTDADSD